MKRLLVAIALTTAVGPVLSASRTATLSVPTMDCPVCPISVKKALTRATRDAGYSSVPTGDTK